MPCTTLVAALAALAFCRGSSAFYLPGIAPVSFPSGAKLDVMANKLTSPSNQLPYDYYSLPFCGADNAAAYRSKHVNLGQMLVGERMKPTDYILKMRNAKTCSVLCSKKLSDADVAKMSRFIAQKYRYVYDLQSSSAPSTLFLRPGSVPHRNAAADLNGRAWVLLVAFCFLLLGLLFSREV
jgi:Endomembrane protein 70